MGSTVALIIERNHHASEMRVISPGLERESIRYAIVMAVSRAAMRNCRFSETVMFMFLYFKLMSITKSMTSTSSN